MLPAPMDDGGEVTDEPGPLPSPPKPYPGFWQAVGLYGVFLLIAAGVIVPVAIADSAFHTKMAQHPATIAAATLGAGGFVLWIARRSLTLGVRQIAGRVAIPREMLLPMGAAVIGQITIVVILLIWILRRFPSLSSHSDYGLDRSLWGGFLLLVIAAPLTEEMLFRGIFLRGFMARYGTSRGIVLGAVLFGFAHFAVAKLLGTILMGVLFGWWYSQLGSIWPGVFGHASNNFIPVLATSLAVGSKEKSPVPAYFWGEPAIALLGAILLAYGVYALRRIFARREADWLASVAAG